MAKNFGVYSWNMVLSDNELGREDNKGALDILVYLSGQWVNWGYGYFNTYALIMINGNVGTRKIRSGMESETHHITWLKDP
jgi:hypothetical protein